MGMMKFGSAAALILTTIFGSAFMLKERTPEAAAADNSAATSAKPGQGTKKSATSKPATVHANKKAAVAPGKTKLAARITKESVVAASKADESDEADPMSSQSFLPTDKAATQPGADRYSQTGKPAASTGRSGTVAGGGAKPRYPELEESTEDIAEDVDVAGETATDKDIAATVSDDQSTATARRTAAAPADPFQRGAVAADQAGPEQILETEPVIADAAIESEDHFASDVASDIETTTDEVASDEDFPPAASVGIANDTEPDVVIASDEPDASQPADEEDSTVASERSLVPVARSRTGSVGSPLNPGVSPLDRGRSPLTDNGQTADETADASATVDAGAFASDAEVGGRYSSEIADDASTEDQPADQLANEPAVASDEQALEADRYGNVTDIAEDAPAALDAAGTTFVERGARLENSLRSELQSAGSELRDEATAVVETAEDAVREIGGRALEQAEQLEATELPALRENIRAGEPLLAEAQNQFYKLLPDDSYDRIAEKLYGDASHAEALAAYIRDHYESPETIQPGDTLELPTPDTLLSLYPPAVAADQPFPETDQVTSVRQTRPAPSEVSPRSSNVAPRTTAASTAASTVNARGARRTYTVIEGDTLFDIARYELGKAGRWSEILELNRQLLGDDIDNLAPGMKLQLPATDADNSAQVRPATRDRY